jgi:hypothetical protein
VGKPPDAVGEALERGSLYRLIPNWKGFWNYNAGWPEPRAFRKDADGGVSMLIAERLTIEQIIAVKPAVAAFGVCEFSGEELVAEDGVWVKLDRDPDFGDAHVSVMGITKRRVDWLRDLALRRIAKAPGPEKPGERLLAT